MHKGSLSKFQLTACSILLSALVYHEVVAQSGAKVLKVTKEIADKVIRETSFEYETKPLKNSGSWDQFRIQQTKGDEQYWAICLLEASDDLETNIGLSFEGEATLYIGDQLKYQGKSKSIKLVEFAYSFFEANQSIPVKLRKGTNKVIVSLKGIGGKPAVAMISPMSSLGHPEDRVKFKAHSIEPSASVWLSGGPFKEKDAKQVLKNLQAYNVDIQSGDFLSNWTAPQMPTIKELKINPNNSFTKDSYADWHYANGGTMLGILNVYAASQDKKYIDFVQRFASNILENKDYFQSQYQDKAVISGSFHKLFRSTMLDDTGGPAIPFAQLKVLDPSFDSDGILEDVLDYVVNRQVRLKDKTFSRPEPENNSIWADDLFMSVPFMCRMAKATGDNTLFDESARQIIQFNKYLLDKKTGLYFHGWYDDRQENSTARWGRANGWVTWAITEALLHIPSSHPEYDKILSIYTDHIKSIAKYQEKSGLWHQVIDHPETFEETSSTAMFTLSLARGISNSWLNQSYTESVWLGWKGIVSRVEKDGTVKGICQGTGIGSSIEFYNKRKTPDHDPRGLGAVLTAGVEVSKLLNGGKKK